MISIRKYLREVCQELKAYEESLTEKELSDFVQKCISLFKDGEGDYDDKHSLEFYILRYALAYGFQFSRMYSAILRDMNEPEQINVTSIGCGTNIDYWGLTYAIEILNGIKCDVDYTGIDPIEWPHRITEQGKLYRKNDTVRNNVVNNGVFQEKNISDFLQFLSLGTELGKNRELSDVYFFPHSIKEVCIHSVPNGELGTDEAYNTYQSMAEFAGQVAESLQDKPVYIAFSYRKRPFKDDEYILSNEDEDKVGVYDMRYGTYLVSCLKSHRLEVELLEPAQETLKGNENGYAFETIEEEELYSRDFFDYPQCKCYTANPKDSEIRKMSDYGKDGKYTFCDIFLNNNKDYTIIEREEWKNTYGENFPIVNTNNMCFQVFRVRKVPMAANECYDSVCSEYQMRIDYRADQVKKVLSKFVIKRNENQKINLYLKNIKEFMEAQGEPKVANYIPTYNFIRNWLVKEGYLEGRIYEGNRRFEPTEYGLKTGMIMNDFVAEDGTMLHNTMISPFFCETLLANIISGKYLNYQLFLQNSMTQEQVEQFPYQNEVFVGENKNEKMGISHFVDVVAKMGMSSDCTITKKDFSCMLVLCGIFEYDKISKEYRASELGRKMGFSTRKINERLYFVANEEAQKFLVSLLAPREVI